jgi:DeoR/GlpR family transcriptional regulator of sugar metabolism
MGTNGFSIEKGATTPDAQQAEAKRALMAMSNQVILLCDSSKFGCVAFARFARIEDVHTLVTDALDSQMSLKLTESGVEVILAKDTGSAINCPAQ